MDSLNLSTSISGDEFRQALTPIVQRELDARLPIAVDSALPRHVKPVVVSAVEAHAETVRSTLEALDDSLGDVKRRFRDAEDELRSRVSTVKKDIDAQLDALEERVKKKANSVLIPAATVVLLVGILAIWAAMGGVILRARSEAQEAEKEFKSLRENAAVKQTELQALNRMIASKQGELLALSGDVVKARADLGTITTEIAAIRSNTALAEMSQQIAALQSTIETLKSQRQAAAKPQKGTNTPAGKSQKK